jgi:hypothetical protein
MPNFLSEAQIERALLQKLQHSCGFDVLECGTENPEDPVDSSNRGDKREVLLLDRLGEAAARSTTTARPSQWRNARPTSAPFSPPRPTGSPSASSTATPGISRRTAASRSG